MEKSDIWKVVLVAAMMAFSALFSGTETAYSSVNKLRLKNYESQGNKKAAKALKLANRFDEVLTAVLIGNNIVNIAASSVSTLLFVSIFGSKGAGLSTAVVTVLVLVFCEVLPKSYAKKNAEKISLAFASPLWVLIVLLKPCVWALNKLSSLFSKGDEAPTVTEDELKYMIDEIEEEGVIEEQESELVKSALEFDEISVEEILIPRVKMIGVDVTDTIDEIKETFTREMYSRLPVYEKSLDNIIGIITNKAFFKMLIEGKDDIRGIIQEVPHIADTKLISEAMRSMQRSKVHLAIVTDQYGGTKGMITLEDIIEELVGEIYDEDDEIITNIVRLADNKYECAGDLNISDLLETLGLDEDMIVTEYSTVGGWITEILEHIPEAGESADSGVFRLTAAEVSEQNVEKVVIEVLPTETPDGEE
ncbi:Hemolysin, contains CBS domains [Ruminococcus sp. YRD2003]|uniref:hemolysin family protein n=1 Tax=Ruminococcus sp. YRD2003 TaxID=1452313 RepID=UPI0008D5D1CB|nr:Hemolysin, contains CBS domains [Ruminococcus flavefaciens]